MCAQSPAAIEADLPAAARGSASGARGSAIRDGAAASPSQSESPRCHLESGENGRREGGRGATPGDGANRLKTTPGAPSRRRGPRNRGAAAGRAGDAGRGCGRLSADGGLGRDGGAEPPPAPGFPPPH